MNISLHCLTNKSLLYNIRKHKALLCTQKAGIASISSTIKLESSQSILLGSSFHKVAHHIPCLVGNKMVMQKGIFFFTACRNKFYNHNLGNSSRYFPFYHTMFSISERTGGAYICGNMSQIIIKNQKQSKLEKVKLQKNEWIRYRRSSKVVTKTICGSYRRPELSSRHPHGFTQCLINYFREIQYLLLTPFGDIHGTYICLQEKNPDMQK